MSVTFLLCVFTPLFFSLLSVLTVSQAFPCRCNLNNKETAPTTEIEVSFVNFCLLTYLILFVWITHNATTKERQCFLCTANLVTWPQFHPSVFICRSTDLLHVSFGLSRAVLPPGVQRMATLAMNVNGILQTWPIHLHLWCVIKSCDKIMVV